MKLFVSPHNDDEVLFGSFTILREKPHVAIVFDSFNQQKRGLPILTEQRRNETVQGLSYLGVPKNHIMFLGFQDSDYTVTSLAITNTIRVCGSYTEIYIPASEPLGNVQHNLVSAIEVPGANICHYMTYTTQGKSTSAYPVKIENGSWISKKLRAMSCYESQMTLDPRCGCYPHFLRDMTEYYER